MDTQQNSQKIPQNSFKEEKPYQSNSNIYHNNEDNKIINNDSNKDAQILELKNEILLLKNQQNQTDSKIKEIISSFQKEIDSLKQQISNLTSELNKLKYKKHPQDNINNINDINENNIDNDENMEDVQPYSIECITRRLNVEILQGSEKANIDIMIRNNSMQKYPSNTFLICDSKKSLLLCEKVKLNELEPRQQQNINIVFKNLKYVSKGKYNCIIYLEINKKVYNSSFVVTVDILPNQIIQKQNYMENFAYPKGIMPGENIGNINVNQNFGSENINDMAMTIIKFKDQFSIYNNDSITDEKIEEALKKYDFDFGKAFASLYQ